MSDFDRFPPQPQGARDGLVRMPPWAWSLIALAVGLALTWWVAEWQQRRYATEREQAWTHMLTSSHDALDQRLRACALMVRSVQALFIASREVTAEEFGNAYANLRAREIFPSLQAIAFARYERREDGDHYITEMVAPMAGNERLPGLDIRSQPANLLGAERSRDTDLPVLSAPFQLVQLSPAGQPTDGVTMRLPIYRAGPPPRTLAERRARVLGSLAVSFRIAALIESALPADILSVMHIEVADVTEGQTRPLYDSHPGLHGDEDAGGHLSSILAYGDRHWRLSMHPLQTGEQLDWRESVWTPGLVVSLLLSLLVWSMTTTRRRALELGWRMSQRFRESEERFRSLNELLPALVLLARADDRRIEYVNQAARERLGAAIGSDTVLESVFADPDDRARLSALGEAGGWRNVELVMQSLNGDPFWASVSLTRMEVDGEQKLLMVAKDISEQRQLTEQLSYQATHDSLTDLYNRREFERRIEAALQARAKGGPPFALLYIDLDQFKLINDTSGHIAGDQLLIQLALIMAEELRSSDVLARLGGDEFGIIAFETRRVDAEALAERLRVRIEAHLYAWEQRSYTVSASIGVVLVDQPGSNLRELLAQADTACYMAKDGGRNRIHFYAAEADDTIQRRGEMEWVNRLRLAIEEGRMLLYYQEMKPLREGPRQGVYLELLLRLRDEQGAVVLPGAFLPAAERYGLVGTLDRWVIGQAIANFGRLHASGPPARCSLNLSAASLEDESIVDDTLALLAEHGVPASSLCFEITETEAVRNLARAVRFIGRLRAAGCSVALDDFGAGMASFGYLKNLPVDVIKIDGSFIRDLDTDPMSRSIVEVIAEIGHQRDLDVVAEWVDDIRLLDVLRSLGVDHAQGFALHRPEPVLFQRRSRS